jgi:ATP-binding cassette subfamily B protein
MDMSKAEAPAGGSLLPVAKPPARRSVRKDLYRMAGLRGTLPDLIMASLFLNLLGLALPLSLLQTYDRILPNLAVGTLIALVSGVLGTVVLETILRVARTTITGWLAARFEFRASLRAFAGLLHMPIETFEQKGIGAHYESLESVNQLKDFYSGQNFLFLLDMPFTLIYLCLIALFTGWLVVVPLALMAAFGLAALWLGKSTRAALEKRMRSDDFRGNFIVEVLSGIHGIKSMAMEALMMRRFERLLETSVGSNLEVAHYGSLATTLAQLFSQLTTIAVVGLGSVMVVHGQITPGILAACSLLGGRCIQPVQGALDRWNRYQMVVPAEERLTEVFQHGDTVAEDKLVVDHLDGRIELEDVSFSYDEGQMAIKPVSLDIAANELIGISGENGSGKTVLLSMLCGRLAPSRGRILLDGHDITELDQEALNRFIVYVPQQPEMFRGTIMENLTLFTPTREDKARVVARALGIDRAVSALPKGYGTMVGEGTQDGLPRGIRQLIVIARALAQEPRILLFDEANTALDGAGDMALQQVLEKLKGKCTIILVTPRPSALRIADRTFKLTDGRLLDMKAAQQMPQVLPLAPAKRAAAEPAMAAGEPVTEAAAESEAQGERVYMDFLRDIEKGSALGRCLYPLLRQLKWSGGLRPLAESLPHFKTDLDIHDFLNVMSNLNYTSSSMKGRMTYISAHLLPCLFVAKNGRPMVMIERREGDILLFDGETGEERLVRASSLRGTAYFLAPVAAGASAMRPGQSWFGNVLGRFRGLIWSVLGVSLLINLLSLGAPIFTMSIYDTVIAAGDLGMLPAFFVGVLIVIFGDEMLREIRHTTTAFLGGRISYLVLSAVFNRTLMLPLPMTERASIGSQLARFKDLDSVRDFFGGATASVLIDMPFVFVYLVLLSFLSPWVAMVPLIALAIFGLAAMAALPLVRQGTRSSGQAAMKRQEFVIEALLKMRALRFAGLERVWLKRYVELTAGASMAGYRSGQLMAALAALSQALIVCSGIMTMAAGAMAVMHGGMSAGALIASMMLVWRVLAPMQSGLAVMLRLEQTRASARQVDTLMSFRSEREVGSHSSGALQFGGSVTFNRVSLRYMPDADPALVGVSFQAKPGEVVAVIGPDGAGKSTLLKLVAGLYAPQAGNVLVDNFDIRQLDPIALRQLIGYVPQGVSLFHGTIAQNLRLAHPTASDAELREAAALAGATEEIEALPGAFNARIGDSRTNRLPASLIQKLSLARAYLKKSPILLLDEPVNGLDFEGDRQFMQFVQTMRGRSTIIMVTHRPSHLNLADQIIVMDHGAIQMVGPANEVRQKLAGAVT